MIYSYLVVSPKTFRPATAIADVYSDWEPATTINVALFLVNHKVNEEVSKVFYTKNIWVICCWKNHSALTLYLQKFPPGESEAKRMERLRLHQKLASLGYDQDILKLLRAVELITTLYPCVMPRFKTIRVKVDWIYADHYPREAMSILKSMLDPMGRADNGKRWEINFAYWYCGYCSPLLTLQRSQTCLILASRAHDPNNVPNFSLLLDKLDSSGVIGLFRELAWGRQLSFVGSKETCHRYFDRVELAKQTIGFHVALATMIQNRTPGERRSLCDD